MLFRIECLAVAVMAQYDYGNLASFASRTYEYADGDYAGLGRSTGSGDDAGLGFAFYDNTYDSAGDGMYDETIFEFPDEEVSFDDMMEEVETTTGVLTTTAPTTLAETTKDQRLRLDRRRPGFVPPPPAAEDLDALVDNFIGNLVSDYDGMFESAPVENAAPAANFVAPMQRGAVGDFGSCLKCEGETQTACKTRNEKMTCIDEDSACLVTIRTRSPAAEMQIFSRCIPLSTCTDHEAQNFRGEDARFYQCRNSVADRWSRGSSCNMCHKMGKSTGEQLLFNSAGNIETGDGNTPTQTSLATIMADAETYFDPDSGSYIYSAQTWY